MYKELASLNDVFEAAKAARDAELYAAALTSFERDERLEESTENTATKLVRAQAISLGEHMIKMHRRLWLARKLGHQSIRPSFRPISYRGDDPYKFTLATPLLLTTESEHEQGLDFIHGWQFGVIAATHQRRVIDGIWKKRVEVLSVKAEGHIKEISTGTDRVEDEMYISLRGQRRPGLPFSPVEAIEAPLTGDPNDPRLYKMYALLNMARRELGDKTVDKMIE